MLPTLSLRKVKAEEIDTIVDIDKIFGPDAFSKYMFEDYMEECNEDNGFFYVLEVEGVLAGYIIAVHDFDGAYIIESIAIRSEFQKVGYGKFLLETIENLIRREGGDEIKLQVSDKNTSARKLYENFGYQYIGNEQEKFYLDGSAALSMKKEFDAY